jgi:DNA-binding transcriptional ArsR family regulator
VAEHRGAPNRYHEVEWLVIVHYQLYHYAVLRTEVDLEALGRIGTALADETRRRLLVELLDGPRYPGELVDALALTKANVSNHLTCLRGCGLVVAEPEGRRVRYELADARFADALRQLTDLALPPADGCEHDRSRR